MEAVKSCWEAFANPHFQRFESFFSKKARRISLKARKWLKSLDLDLFGVLLRQFSEGLDVFAKNGRNQKVCQTARADAEVTVLDELFAEHFAHDGVEINGFVHRFDSADSLGCKKVSGELLIFLDG